MDDRHNLYGEEFLKDYLKAVRLTPDWEKFLNEKKVNWVLVPSESPLANMLEEHRGGRWFTGIARRCCLCERQDRTGASREAAQ